MTRLKEKLNALQGDAKPTEQTTTSLAKRKVSRNIENKENIDLDTFEAETARIHQDLVEKVQAYDSARGSQREKRTLSDNTRPLHDQKNHGVKILKDKTNNMHSSGNAFALKKPVQMATDRPQSQVASYHPADEYAHTLGSNSSRRHHGQGSYHNMQNYKLIK